MKNSFFLKAALISLMSFPLLWGFQSRQAQTEETETTASDTLSTLSVMSFNIRYDNPEDGSNVWKNRLPKVNAFLDSIAPDVIGAQEVLHNQLEDLLSAHSGYAYYGVGREDGLEKGEYQPLFWKKDNFELIDKGHFWLSETPNTPSLGWDAACERTAVWVILKKKKTGREFFFLNTHLDHMGQTARANSVRMIKERALSLAGDREIVITGDFNADPSSDVILAMEDNEGQPRPLLNSRVYAKEVSGSDWSFHDFGKEPENERTIIDYIFIGSDGGDILSNEILTEDDSDKGHLYLSDHAPVLVTLLL